MASTAAAPASTRAFPVRYQPLKRLGKGGGGEVWSVRDVVDGRTYALKVLAEGASAEEAQALVREASSLSGLEGLGMPRVHRFGRLPAGQPFLLRDLIEGSSLAELLERGVSPERALGALVQATALLTRLHRGALIHGDLKPANLIVDDAGQATLVDFGLSSAWQGSGAARGLTPGHGAPELLRGEPPSAASDVFALGVTLRAVLSALAAPGALPPEQRRALDAVVARATADQPRERFPSADELGAALRSALGWPAPQSAGLADAVWPVVGIDPFVEKLRMDAGALPPGRTLEIHGRSGAGKSSVLRRLAWALGVAGQAVAWVEARAGAAERAVEVELAALAPGGEGLAGALILVDDAGLLSPGAVARLRAAQALGARLVVTGGGGVEWLGGAERVVGLPPLSAETAAALLRQATRSLNDAVLAYLVRRAAGRPGRLRALVARLDHEVVVGVPDVERLLRPAPVEEAADPVARAARALDQGRLPEARAALEPVPYGTSLEADLLRARLVVSEGDAPAAAALLDALEPRVTAEPARRALWLDRARVALRRGAYADAVAWARRASDGAPEGPALAEALACAGVAESFLGQHEPARLTLGRAVVEARRSGSRRVEALALSSLALALQRGEQPAAARGVSEEALEAAEETGDAAAVATIRLNLAALAGGEMAAALAHLEAAVDMGQKAGRAATVRQALLNLANLDLALGRLASARGRIEALAAQRDELSEGQRAQLLGLEASDAARAGDPGALALYERCARAYERLGRAQDAAEALVESVLVACDGPAPDLGALAATLDRVTPALEATALLRAPLRYARARLALRRGDEGAAREALDRALEAAREAGQREWAWQILAARARSEQAAGRSLAARRDAEEALAALEEAASRLPRDLREVYWSDPRRRAVQALASEGVTGRAPPGAAARVGADDRLERILEINRDLATVHDLGSLLPRVLEHASALLGAERGYVLLAGEDGALSVAAARGLVPDEAHRSFSRSIAEQAIGTGEPVVTRSAREDERLRGYESVHLLNLQSVACTPIRSPRGGWIGALYLETRRSGGARFELELPALRAFADQTAIAIENARLIEENARRADALASANRDLEATQQRLRELLDQKRAQLESTRRDLKDTRAVLRGHFGYQNLVGTSAPMRRLYALIDRVKDADIPVLITGESGTGKEIVARAIHDAGPRARRAFTGVNCGAIPETLLESELFGHIKGAFTSADRDRPGLFREAEGGTLLLDEIGEMPTKMQAGLLRVLQERKVRPVGGVREEAIDVRVIAATHRDLESLVQTGVFREDLLYRLRVVEIHIPPLRERPEDIPALVDHFLQIFAARYRRERGVVSREALRRLVAQPWPGNVRQLQNVLLNAWVLSESPELGPDAFDLPSTRPAPAASAPREAPSTAPADELPPSSYADHRASEKERILQALKASGWNRVKAAQLLNMPRRTFYRRLHDYGIQ